MAGRTLSAGAMLPLLLTLVCRAGDPPKPPLGLIPVIWPQDNPYTPEKAGLGRLLYFDPRLSGDGKISCATCHEQTTLVEQQVGAVSHL